MKAWKKYAISVVLILSVLCNFLLCYYLYELSKPSDSIFKMGFDEHSIDIYCEVAPEVESYRVNQNKNSITVGNATLLSGDDALYLVTPDDKINLSENGGDAYVINSNGDILYQLVNPETKQTETVFATPSGKKYHKDPYCAGKTAFEAPLETVKLFRSPCSICAS